MITYLRKKIANGDKTQYNSMQQKYLMMKLFIKQHEKMNKITGHFILNLVNVDKTERMPNEND